MKPKTRIFNQLKVKCNLFCDECFGLQSEIININGGKLCYQCYCKQLKRKKK